MEDQVIYLASIFVTGIAAQWIAWRLRLPSILLLLAFGFGIGLLGEAGWVAPPEKVIGDELLFPLVSLAVAVILFEGGLSLRLSELRETGGVVLRLATIAVLITWALSTWAARTLLGFDTGLAALLGAVLVVSGPTVIGPLLRHVRPTKKIGSIIKWEGIVNDPIGAVLAVLVLDTLLDGGFVSQSIGATLLSLLVTLLMGTVLGFLAAGVLLWPLKRYLIPDYLHSAVFLAIVIATFAVSNALRPEAGLVTVTALGIILANQKIAVVQHVIEFKENLRVLLISTLFILLSSRVTWNDMQSVGWQGVLFVAVLILLVRPITVLVSTLGSELSKKERLFLCWIHPRGIVAAAVSALFALELTTHGAELSPELAAQAEKLAPITFLVIVGTVTVYGLTAAPLARWLGLSRQDPQGILFAGAAPWIQSIARAVQEEGFEVMLTDTNYRNISDARVSGLPTCFASILSEHVHEEEDLGGIGRLLAMTPNNEVNSLATIKYAEDFGRAEVYRLAPTEADVPSRTKAADSHAARQLFGKEITYPTLARRFAEGQQVKTTNISDDYTFEDFQARYGTDALILFVIEETGKLTVCTADNPVDPKPGQKFISLVNAPEDETSAA